MRISMNLDDGLLKEAFEYTGVATKQELVEIALKEFVENHRRKNLLDLAGKIKFYEAYDHKKNRLGRSLSEIWDNEKDAEYDKL